MDTTQRCPLGQVARNETGALCQHWAAIKAAVLTIRKAMASGVYDNLIFVDSHSPGNPEDPAQVWTECTYTSHFPICGENLVFFGESILIQEVNPTVSSLI